MAILGFTITSISRPSLSVLPTPFPTHPPHLFSFSSSSSSSFTLKPQPSICAKPAPFSVFAGNNNELREEREQGNQGRPSRSNGDDDDNSSKQGRPILSFNWNSLLDPDPDNVLALGLTGLLTWASAQVLLQLLFISLAILVAALKYSFIAALLIFILITLL